MQWLKDGTGPQKTTKPDYKTSDQANSYHRAMVLIELEESILLEIQEWLNEMVQHTPGFKIWFQVDFPQRFPEFMDWKKKKNLTKQHNQGHLSAAWAV